MEESYRKRQSIKGFVVSCAQGRTEKDAAEAACGPRRAYSSEARVRVEWINPSYSMNYEE